MKTSSLNTAATAAGPPLRMDWQHAIESFVEFQCAHRGLSRSSLDRYRTILSAFARHASPANGAVAVMVDRLQARHIDAFVVEYATPRGRRFAGRVVPVLRSFLRYLALFGRVSPDLAAQVPRPRAYRLAELPRALGGEEIRRILRAARRSDARGRRDYAILVLLASYGLRSGDIVALRLEDLQWRQGTISVHTRKTGRPLVLPITDPVGDALAAYLRRGRPQSDFREVFLSLSWKPVRPLGKAGILQIVRRAIDRAGVNLRGVAAHAFRHGFASRLVRRGVALHTIADCLGHASIETTFIYTKLQVEDLRSVSLDPREVIS